MSHAIVLHIGAFELHAESKDSEPTVLDLVVGARAGLARPRKIREHIRRGIEDGTLREGEHFRREFPSRPIGAMGISPKIKAYSAEPSAFLEKFPPPQIGAMGIPERIEEEFWLTEAGTLKIVTRLRTPMADAIVDEMIRVYRLAIRQLHEREPKAPVRILAEVAHGPRVGDSEILRREVSFYCHVARMSCGVSVQNIHSFLRREFRIAGVYHLSVLLWPQAKAMLEALGMGRLVLPLRARALPRANPKQQKVWS